MSPRFRIPYRRYYQPQTIPLREQPLFNFIPPKVTNPAAVRTPPMRQNGYVRPETPYRAPGYGSQQVLCPPIPEDHVPYLSPDDVGPVGPPAQVSLADIGPVGLPPDLPDWLIEESRVKAPDIKFPEMPQELIQEGRNGVRVAPQVSDYIAPPVTTPRELVTMADVTTPPSDAEILEGVQGKLKTAPYDAPNLSSVLTVDDLGGLLKSTSRFNGGIGQTHGRTVGEGI